MLRDAVKRALPRLARTAVGKHLVHAALEGDRAAGRFRDVRAWPTAVHGLEDLDFLFTSSQLNHGVASLRFDEASLLFRLARDLGSGSIVELGRYKGGSTFVMATAKDPAATILSIDLHVGHPRDMPGADLDRELRAALDRFGIEGVELVVGDTRQAPLPGRPVDLLFIDADHRYDGARADVDRWSPTLRAGGHLVLHDAVDTGGWGTVYPGLHRLVGELERDARFVRQPDAGTMAWFVRQGANDA